MRMEIFEDSEESNSDGNAYPLIFQVTFVKNNKDLLRYVNLRKLQT